MAIIYVMLNHYLAAMAKQLYDYWFVQFDFPDANGRPYKSSGGKMVWNEKLKREIPDGWDVVSVDDILDKYPTIAVRRNFYHKVSCLFESSSGTLTGSSGLL